MLASFSTLIAFTFVCPLDLFVCFVIVKKKKNDSVLLLCPLIYKLMINKRDKSCW